MPQLVTPVVLIIFNRPVQTSQVFAAIRDAHPSKLFLVADGPRLDRVGEADLCKKARQIVSKIDWPCEVKTNFADENLGCRRRVISGLNWVFSQVEEAIILEDDCHPHESFFPFCSETLQRYRDSGQIGFVAGFNSLESHFPFPYSYYFTQMTPIWGWATWRRAWTRYDETLSSWPEVKESGLLELLLPDKRMAEHWSKTFDTMYRGKGPNTWDFQWTYTCWMQNWLNVLPRCNLVENIGFGADATHTTIEDPVLKIPAKPMSFPLQHPPAITPWPEHAKELQREFFQPNIWKRIRRRMRIKQRHPRPISV